MPSERLALSSETGALAVRAAPVLRASTVSSAKELEHLVPAYEALVDAVRAPVSMRWRVVDVWVRTHPADEPSVVLVHRGDVLVAAVAGLVEGRRHRLVLADLRDPDPTTELLAARLRRSVRLPEAEVPVLDVRASASGSGLSRNTRQAAAKARNRARREGHELAMSWTSSPDEVEAALFDLQRLHVRRNADLGRQPLLLDPAERTVFEETARSNARAGGVRLLLTTLDDELAAFALRLVDQRTWWVWANHADPAWLRHSPGTVTNAEVVRAAAAEPDVDHLDWGAGVQRCKLSGPVHLLRRQRVESSSPAVALLLEVAQRARATRHGVRRRLRRRLRHRRDHRPGA